VVTRGISPDYGTETLHSNTLMARQLQVPTYSVYRTTQSRYRALIERMDSLTLAGDPASAPGRPSSGPRAQRHSWFWGSTPRQHQVSL
jgi:hypothetical protein